VTHAAQRAHERIGRRVPFSAILKAIREGRSQAINSPELFAVPPPVPTVAEGRRYRRSARRQEQYWARNRDTNMCAQCGRFPRKSPTHSRCERCCEAQRRSASKRKDRNISQSMAHQPQTESRLSSDDCYPNE
jgi:transposase